MIASLLTLTLPWASAVNFAMPLSGGAPPRAVAAPLSCYDDLRAEPISPSLLRLARYFNGFKLGDEHRLVIDAALSASSEERIRQILPLSDAATLPILLYRAAHAAANEVADIDLRPRREHAVELALKFWPRDVRRQLTEGALEPTARLEDQGPRLREINRQVQGGQLQAFLTGGGKRPFEANESLRLAVDFELPEESLGFAQRSRNLTRLKMSPAQVKALAENVFPFRAALVDLRFALKSPGLDLKPWAYAQQYGPRRFTVVYFPELRIPEGLDRAEVYVRYYLALYQRLNRMDLPRAIEPSSARVHTLRQRAQAYLAWRRFQRLSEENEIDEWTLERRFIIRSAWGPVSLGGYTRSAYTP